MSPEEIAMAQNAQQNKWVEEQFKRDARKLALQSAATGGVTERQVDLKLAEEIYQWLIKDL